MQAIRRASVALTVIVALVAVATAVMGALGALNYRLYRDESADGLRRETAIQADQLAVSLALPVWNIDRVEIDRILDALAADHNVYAIVVQAAGHTHARVRDGSWRLVSGTGDLAQAGLLHERRSITSSGDPVGSLQLFVTPLFLERDLATTRRRIVASILAVDLLLVLGVYLVLWIAVLKPIMDIERYAVAVKSGKAARIVPPRTLGFARELESLRTSIQAMVELLDRRYAELRDEEKKYRDIFEFSPFGIYQARPDGTLITANGAFARMVGCEDAAAALGLNLAHDVYDDPGERGRLIARYERLGHGRNIELRLKRRDGTPFWAELSAHAIKDEAGTTLYFESFVQDIDARKAAEEGLRASEERYRLLFDGNPVPMLVFDLERLTFLAANEAAVRQYGYSREELLGLSLPRLATPDDPSLSEFLTRRFDPRPDVLHVGFRQQRRKDGTVVDIDVVSIALVLDGRPARLMLARDVSAEARAQAEQERLRESLRRSESMAAMGSLVAGVAHEVRNPLFSISATVDALESEMGDNEDYAEYGRLLRSQVARLTRLMRDLLDYGKTSVVRRGPTRFADVVRRSVRACAPLARERQVRVEEDVAGDMPTLDIEAARVEQAVENLLANAIQHAPVGSLVRVRGTVDTSNGEPAARCTVEDEGPGIPLEDLGHIFEPFFSRRQGGTGLGLPIVQRVAEAHGGAVTAENRAEGGARFTLVLPIADVRA